MMEHELAGLRRLLRLEGHRQPATIRRRAPRGIVESRRRRQPARRAGGVDGWVRGREAAEGGLGGRAPPALRARASVVGAGAALAERQASEIGAAARRGLRRRGDFGSAVVDPLVASGEVLAVEQGGEGGGGGGAAFA